MCCWILYKKSRYAHEKQVEVIVVVQDLELEVKRSILYMLCRSNLTCGPML